MYWWLFCPSGVGELTILFFFTHGQISIWILYYLFIMSGIRSDCFHCFTTICLIYNEFREFIRKLWPSEKKYYIVHEVYREHCEDLLLLKKYWKIEDFSNWFLGILMMYWNVQQLHDFIARILLSFWALRFSSESFHDRLSGNYGKSCKQIETQL